ncbi:prenylcysteine oxidase 1 isoform X2 [Plectropomus leopardus]|uniref:prenylcysteine oxidase 1 isoform X2 n=1 Tax=Plectropomus leopardus TaxID=160734 RepID=UPI001C4AB943|nr:prenylcysteine oxidase 1 isoform X2 [Plectropomus leopardus]
MNPQTLSLRALLFLGLWHTGRRSLASAPELQDQPKKIAVVGAGIGGTAAAFYLRQEFGDGVKIDVFEPGAIGGRLATVKIGDYEYETGGSVIHPLNLHMKHFIEKLGIPPRTDVPSKMAIFDGKELTFEESDWFLVNFFHMIWRYGFSFLRMHMWVESILDKFMRIYQYQQYGYSFSSVDKLLHAMGGDSFLTLVNQTLEETMIGEGFSQVFINDIVAPITRVNYGQSVRIHGFVGAVSLAGADSGLWAVDGGNKRVCSGLLYHSKSELITANVTSISVKVRPSKTAVLSGREGQWYQSRLSMQTCDVTEDIRGCKLTTTPNFPPPRPAAKMRFLVPLFVFLAVAAFHSALSAFLESAEKEEAAAQHDGLTKLQKIDQMEFEAAQKSEAAQMNVTEEQNEETRYLEATQDGSVEEHIETGDNKTAGGGGTSDVAAQEGAQSSESSEEADGRQRREHHEAVPEAVSNLDEVSQDSTKKEQDVLE